MARLVMVVVAGIIASRAGARPHVHLHILVDAERSSVAGRMWVEVENTTHAALDHLELWRYPARLERRSAALDDHNFYWVYPRSFDPGAMDLTNVIVDGNPVSPRYRDHERAGAGTIIELPLATPLAPGKRARIETEFSTRVPRRYGSFGCYEGACMLAGGFYPMPIQLDEPGYDRGAPPSRADIDIQVDGNANENLPEVLIDGERRSTAHLENAAWATVMTAPHFAERVATHRGVTIHYFHRGPGSPAFVDGNRPSLLLADLREAIELLHELDFPLPPNTSINLVEAPLRMELAEPQAGCVLVSDQLYRMFPLARFRKFHSFQVVRAVFAMLYERNLSAAENALDLAVSPDAGASFLVDKYTIRTWRMREFASDLLRWVSFIPTIDRILYAPQVQFATAYFNSLDEPNPTRDDLRRFANDLPRGKVIYEKLRDLVGDAGTERIMRRLWEGVPLREAATREYGKPLAWFFAQWLGRYPDVDYRFEIVSRERRAGKDGGGHRYRVHLYKVGGAPPVEPVEVRVTEWGGQEHLLKWDGEGRETVLTVDTRRAIQSIVLDPRGRLVERNARGNDDLRLDDRSPAPVKFIYNSFGALLNLATGSLDVSLDFSLSRIFDVKNVARLAVYHNEASLVGGFIAYSRNFGSFITPSRLSSAMTTSLIVDRLDSSFARAGVAPQPGTRVTAGLGLGYDDRFFVWEPMRYLSASASLSYALTILDGTVGSGVQTFQQMTALVDVARLFPITPGHGVVVEARLAATFGDLKVASQALYAGGANGLRGYQPDELPGSAFGMVRGEYRHVFVHDLNFNIGTVAFLRGISGAVFAEGAVIAPCGGFITQLHNATDPSHDLAHNIFSDVGYSFRLLGDWLGVAQTQFNIDVALPLSRRALTCFPEPGDGPPIAPSARLPVGFYIYFGQPW